MRGLSEPLVEDILFLAVTRPAMWLGAPLEAALPIAFAGVLMLLVSGNPLYAAGFGVAAFAAARLVVRHDPNAFRLMMLWIGTKARCRNRAVWGGSSYSPLPTAGTRRAGFAR
ncbi:type IV secretion system protein VirB3 [Sphingomonas crocodyli]|uniref:Type VI secretion protein n=1 Tax=Sphingomonas crocodyli TaxID=1979270 RepID=A0A437LY26_9SPHN|nr:VirB3 family type IV secretion system protein [Sphingomonas crocodyli]RVT90301.1 type VI secretion protein [Sphingomonas crocodyli]